MHYSTLNTILSLLLSGALALYIPNPFMDGATSVASTPEDLPQIQQGPDFDGAWANKITRDEFSIFVWPNYNRQGNGGDPTAANIQMSFVRAEWDPIEIFYKGGTEDWENSPRFKTSYPHLRGSTKQAIKCKPGGQNKDKQVYDIPFSPNEDGTPFEHPRLWLQAGHICTQHGKKEGRNYDGLHIWYGDVDFDVPKELGKRCRYVNPQRPSEFTDDAPYERNRGITCVLPKNGKL